MTCVLNANDFLLEMRRIRGRYEDEYQKLLNDIRHQLTQTVSPDEENEVLEQLIKREEDTALEAHIRQYLIDPFFRALNWKFESSNIIPEAPVRASISTNEIAHGKVKFLDYFGIESETQKALLIVEAKAPEKYLPREKYQRKAITESSVRETLLNHLNSPTDSKLTDEWKEWLDTLHVYVQSVKKQSGVAPGRVVSTNGKWLILFANPEQTFLDSSISSSADIYIYKDFEALENRANEIFQLLEYKNVLRNILGKTPSLSLGEVAFELQPSLIESTIHGLKILYIEEPGFFDASPVIKVMPILLIRTKQGAWFRIESKQEERIPHNVKELPDHLNKIEIIAIDLLSEINEKLAETLTITSLTDYYSSQDIFSNLKGVSKLSEQPNLFIVVTGENTHYFLKEPTVPGCPYHDWQKIHNNGDASENPFIVKRSIKPRAFFISGEQHHCSHQEVHIAKSSQITPRNRDRCGLRSGKDHEAFCEIWDFETHLCCRTCAFEEVCTKAQVFQLPCERSS